MIRPGERRPEVVVGVAEGGAAKACLVVGKDGL